MAEIPSNDRPEICAMCGEPGPDLFRGTEVVTQEGVKHAHAACLLRNAIGGIGHLIAHNYWCVQKGDPDAGLTYYQSARLASEYINLIGHRHTEQE